MQPTPSPHLHAQTLLAAGRHKHLNHFSVVIAVRCIFLVFYFLVMLPSEIPKLPTDPSCYCVESSPSQLPPQDRSLSLNPLSLFSSFIFCSISF